MADSLLVKLGLDNTAFERGIGKASKSVFAFRNTVRSISAAFGVGFAISSITQFCGEIVKLNKEAKKLDITGGMPKELRRSADEVGASSSDLESALGSLNEKIFEAHVKGGNAAKTFKNMGISLTDSSGRAKPTSKILAEVATQFKNADDSSKSAAAAYELFGKNAVEMNQILGQSADKLAEFANQTDKVGATAKNIERVSKSFEWLEGKVFGLLAGISEFAEYLSDDISDAVRGVSKGATAAVRRQAEAEAERMKKLMKMEIERKKQREADLKQAEADLAEFEKEEEAAANERKKSEEEYAKLMGDSMAKRAQMQYDELKTIEKIRIERENIRLETERLANLEATSIDYAKTHAKITEHTAKLKELEKTHTQEINDAEEKRKKAVEDIEAAENRLNDLYDQRKKTLDDIAKRTKDALDATMQLIGDKGRGQTKQKMDKSAKYAEKAETAKAEGRMNDYFRYSKKSEEYKERAVDERRDMLQSKGREALKRGDRETFDKLKDEYNKEGFGKGKPDDEQAKKLDKIAEETEKTRQNLDKLVNGLQGE